MQTTASTGQTAEFMVITPELAKEWLEKYNQMNRTRRERREGDYAAAMDQDEWDGLNGTTISFDTDGQLADGQHRLGAIVRSGIPVETLVVYGIKPEARATIDDALKRKFADDLAMNGITNTLIRASLLRKILTWDANGGLVYLSGMRFSRKFLSRRWPVYEKEIIDADHAAIRFEPRWQGNRGSLYFMYWLLRYRVQCDERAVIRFFSIITMGSQSKEDECLRRLRDKLQNGRHISAGGHVIYEPAWKEVYWLIKAWNAWLSGAEYTSALYRDPREWEDPYPMPMPAVAGGKDAK